MESKMILGYIGAFIAFVGYIPYFRDIFKGTTKPHAISWFIWGLITSTIFVVQLLEGGGAGSWVTGVSGLLSFVIYFFAFFKGEKKFVTIDYLSLGGALLGIFLWILTKEPLSAVIVLSITDTIGYIPTLRKAFFKPYEETLSTWLLCSLKYVFPLFAFDVFSVLNWLYPVTLIFMNMLVAILLIVRRKMIKRN